MKWSPSGFFCILYFLVAVPQSLGWATRYFGPTRMNIISSPTIISQRRREASLPLVSLQAKSNAIPDDYEDRESRKKSRRRRMSVGAILASSFLNLLGFTMTGPITPALGKHFQLEVGASFGSLTSAYPLGMLFGLFLWPYLSDSLGRKPIMVASLLGSGLGLCAQSYVVQREFPLSWFLLARVMTGAFAGNSPVSKAYLADVGYKDGKLPKYLALRDAASTMAFIVGPMLGGILYDIRRRLVGGAPDMAKAQVLSTSGSLAFVIGVSAVASLVAAFSILGFVSDIKPKKNKKKTDQEPDEGYADDQLIACPLGARMWAGVASVCVVSFLFNIGDSTFHAFFSALLRDGAGVGTKEIGVLYTLLASVSFLVSTGAASRMLKSFGPVATCALGLGCVGSGLVALGLAAWPGLVVLQPTFTVLASAAALYYCGVPLYGPTIPTMLLRCVPSHRRGAIMGLDGTINTIGRIVAPLVMGDVYRRCGAGAAFGLAGVAAFGGSATALFRRFVVLRKSYLVGKPQIDDLS